MIKTWYATCNGCNTYFQWGGGDSPPPRRSKCEICEEPLNEWTVTKLLTFDDVQDDIRLALTFAHHTASCQMVTWEPDCDCGLYALKQKYKE